MLGPLVVVEVWVLSMVDWQPLINAAALFLGAIAVAVPTLLVLWKMILEQQSHGKQLDAQSAQLAVIDTNTNGNLAALREEVARLMAVVAASSGGSERP